MFAACCTEDSVDLMDYIRTILVESCKERSVTKYNKFQNNDCDSNENKTVQGRSINENFNNHYK